MISSWAVEASRSTADWASSGSAIMDSHSSAVRLEVTTVEVLLVAFDAELVEVGGLGRVQGLEREVVEDEQFDAGEAAHLGVEGVVEAGGLEPLEQLGGGAMWTVRRRRTAMCPSAQARWVLPTPTGPRIRAPCGPSRNRS